MGIAGRRRSDAGAHRHRPFSHNERSPLPALAFDERDDFGEGRAGGEDLAYAQPLELGGIVGRNRPAAEKHDVARVLLAQLFDDQREERHVGAGEDREADPVGVFLDRGLDDLFGGLKEPGVDHFHPRVAQCARYHLGATVVSVESGFGDDDAERAFGAHDSRPSRSRSRLSSRASFNIVRTTSRVVRTSRPNTRDRRTQGIFSMVRRTTTAPARSPRQNTARSVYRP